MALVPLLAGMAIACGLSLARAAAPGVVGATVSVLNWSDYIDPGVLDDFTGETGIRIVYDTYDSLETLAAKLASGKGSYDVVIAPASVVERQLRAGLLQKLRYDKLTNGKNLAPEVVTALAAHDPGNAHAIDYLWFTAGIAYDTAEARNQLGQADPQQALASLDIVFRPELLKAFAGCGVYLTDSPEAMFALALKFLKLSPASRNDSDLVRAADLLLRIQPFVKVVPSGQLTNALATGKACLAVAWASEVFLARNRARAAGHGIDLGYVVPREGSLIWLDSLFIPADAPHPDAAYRFIDFLMRPEIAARNTNATDLPDGIIGSKALVDPALANDPAVFPSNDVMQRLFPVPVYDGRAQQFIAKVWAKMRGVQAQPAATAAKAAAKTAGKPVRRRAPFLSLKSLKSH